MSIITLLIANLVLVLLIFFLVKFEWCIKTIREICHSGNEGGYTKFIQITLTGILIIIFLTITVYYIINPSKVDKIDIILTVTVGWLGAIVSTFFGERSMKHISTKQQQGIKKASLTLKEFESTIGELIKKVK